jgi:hypothetical protein
MVNLPGHDLGRPDEAVRHKLVEHRDHLGCVRSLDDGLPVHVDVDSRGGLVFVDAGQVVHGEGVVPDLQQAGHEDDGPHPDELGDFLGPPVSPRLGSWTRIFWRCSPLTTPSAGTGRSTTL